MIVDMPSLRADARYHWMTQAIIPRPVAWMLTENDGGDYNLAPFSYFNALCSAPPLIGVSMSDKPGGSPKDTLYNVRARKSFVVHIASTAMLSSLNESSATLPYGDSELTRLDIKTESFGEMLRIAECPVAMLCSLHDEVALGANGQTLILGEIRLLYAADSVIVKDAKGRETIDAQKTDPVARLSAGNYARLGELMRLQRPA